MAPLRVAIIGGGPGGLMTAYRLEQKSPMVFDVTLFEASSRLGGKLLTPRFETSNVYYEAGAAELYDYSQLGPDPLRELVQALGLKTRPMSGDGVFVGDRWVANTAGLGQTLGSTAVEALAQFEEMARGAISPAEYYESDWRADNNDPMAKVTFEELLDGIPNEDVRRYLEVAVHSDLATEPNLTRGSYGLQNWLMNGREYMQLYSIDGGLERLTDELARRLETTTVRFNQPVLSVEQDSSESYLVRSRVGEDIVEDEFDFIVAALPNSWLSLIDWRGGLRRAMRRHTSHYRHHAHYLRVSLLYDRPFWRNLVNDSYFMIDAFGGCCVYDESARNGGGLQGVLGLLIAGEAALTYGNLPDAQLVEVVRRSLPASLQESSAKLLESRVHRWLGSVSGLPGGYPLADPDARHLPDPENNPWFFVVGDYLFDSTLNGVLDSADTVVEMLADEEAEVRATTPPDIYPASEGLLPPVSGGEPISSPVQLSAPEILRSDAS